MSTPVYLKRNVQWPYVNRAVIREDGVHTISHSGQERPVADYPSLEAMNTKLRELGFVEFEIDHAENKRFAEFEEGHLGVQREEPSEMSAMVEEAMKIAKRAEKARDEMPYGRALRTLLSEIERLRGLVFPQQGTEADKIMWKDHHAAAIDLASEQDKRIGELQDEVERLKAAVLGEYDRTADTGQIIGQGVTLYFVNDDGAVCEYDSGYYFRPAANFYSTREAAEAARRKQ